MANNFRARHTLILLPPIVLTTSKMPLQWGFRYWKKFHKVECSAIPQEPDSTAAKESEITYSPYLSAVIISE